MLSGDFWQNMSCQFPPKYSSWGWCHCRFHHLLLAFFFFFFKHTPYRGACESTFRSFVRLDQCANGTANITHYPDSSLAVTTKIISNGVNMSQEYYLLLLHVRCGTAVEHIHAWCSANCQRACLHQRKNTKTRTSCKFIATVSVIWLTLRFFFFVLLINTRFFFPLVSHKSSPLQRPEPLEYLYLPVFECQHPGFIYSSCAPLQKW